MIPLDAATVAALAHRRLPPGYSRAQYLLLARAWLPLLQAAMVQPNATIALASAVERILAELPQELQPAAPRTRRRAAPTQ